MFDISLFPLVSQRRRSIAHLPYLLRTHSSLEHGFLASTYLPEEDEQRVIDSDGKARERKFFFLKMCKYYLKRWNAKKICKCSNRQEIFWRFDSFPSFKKIYVVIGLFTQVRVHEILKEWLQWWHLQSRNCTHIPFFSTTTSHLNE